MKRGSAVLLLAASLSTLAADRPAPYGTHTIHIPGFRTYTASGYPVYGPAKTPFAALLGAAANLELAGSGLSMPDVPRVQATLDEFDFSSVGGGQSTLRATLRSQGSEPLTVQHVHTYSVSAGAVAGCAGVTNAMVPAIESFLHVLYADARFVELMQTPP